MILLVQDGIYLNLLFTVVHCYNGISYIFLLNGFQLIVIRNTEHMVCTGQFLTEIVLFIHRQDQACADNLDNITGQFCELRTDICFIPVCIAVNGEGCRAGIEDINTHSIIIGLVQDGVFLDLVAVVAHRDCNIKRTLLRNMICFVAMLNNKLMACFGKHLTFSIICIIDLQNYTCMGDFDGIVLIFDTGSKPCPCRTCQAAHTQKDAANGCNQNSV